MRVSQDFYERLESIMVERGMNQTEVAQLVRTAPSTLTRWRRGAVPQRNMLTMLARALGVELEWLAKGTGPRVADWSPPKQLGNYEKQPNENRLNEHMGYSTSKEPEEVPPLAALENVMDAMTIDELLSLMGRLKPTSTGSKAVQGEIRKRAAGKLSIPK